ncbi:MAG TPA: YggT family protein [Burkholderiaceae bacterium]|nr:YggT family protein [Burkholderiaceae bacterium]
MLSNIFSFIVTIAFTLFGVALILRAWSYAIRLHPFNPYSQAIFSLTDWLVQPIRRFVGPSGRFDTPSIIACWLTAFVFQLIIWVTLTGQAPLVQMLLPTVFSGIFMVFKWTFNLILWATLIQVVLSWVNPAAPIMPVLQTLTAPLLNPIRRLIPNFGGLDFSPLVLIILAQIGIVVLEQIVFSLAGI